MQAVLCGLALLLLSTGSLAQERPAGGLTADFHRGRRAALRAAMPPGSVAVLFAAPVRRRANDVDYVYHPDPDFYYLTGYIEPHAALLIFAEPQQDSTGSYSELLYVQPRDARTEMWTGRRLGVEGARATLGIDRIASNEAFIDRGIDLGAYAKILTLPLPEDVRPSQRSGDLYTLLAHFRASVPYPDDEDPMRTRIYELIRSTDIDNKASVAQVIDRYFRYRSDLGPQDPLRRYLEVDDEQDLQAIRSELPAHTVDLAGLSQMLNALREIKSPEELALLRRAIDISAVGQIEVMKAMHPGMSEREVQGIHEFVYKKYGAEYEGYPSIVGAGENGCILHYIDNLRPRLDSDLVLMDLGAEYRGYTADVTRTIPADGRFSPEQRAIYELVLAAQDAALAACRPGAPFHATHGAAQAVIDSGLVALGIVEPEAFHRYFPHGTSHYLGLDVHDRGTYGPLQPGTVITVEPGIYIPQGSPCDPRWWGIAVRIEDDVLITATGYELLSGRAPRTVAEIEATMAQPSALDDFVLPSLDR
ncbi:MAG: hypothetical protein OHK0039_39040 [Bacteroidia bacterium]